jgi:hypothetical protein
VRGRFRAAGQAAWQSRRTSILPGVATPPLVAGPAATVIPPTELVQSCLAGATPRLPDRCQPLVETPAPSPLAVPVPASVATTAPHSVRLDRAKPDGTPAALPRLAAAVAQSLSAQSPERHPPDSPTRTQTPATAAPTPHTTSWQHPLPREKQHPLSQLPTGHQNPLAVEAASQIVRTCQTRRKIPSRRRRNATSEPEMRNSWRLLERFSRISRVLRNHLEHCELLRGETRVTALESGRSPA